MRFDADDPITTGEERHGGDDDDDDDDDDGVGGRAPPRNGELSDHQSAGLWQIQERSRATDQFRLSILHGRYDGVIGSGGSQGDRTGLVMLLIFSSPKR